MSNDPETPSEPPAEVPASEGQLADAEPDDNGEPPDKTVPAPKGKVRRWLLSPWTIWPAAAVVVIGLGMLVGWALLVSDQFNQACGPNAQLSSWKGIDVSGLPSNLEATFGYGRGTQSIESTLTATAQRGTVLPSAIGVYAEPLATSDGTQTIPTLSNKKLRPDQRGISAVAVQIPGTSTYELEVCVRAPNAVAGLYSSQLLFPGGTLSSGASLPVSVTFQSPAVPFLLTVGIVPLALLGMIYTTLFLIRRNNPALELNQLPKELRVALCSINGVFALIVSIGAVFTAWSAQCYRNPTFGTPWPTLLLTLVTMTGAASVASTVPMGLSSKGTDKTAGT
jgi:hypothetical protein